MDDPILFQPADDSACRFGCGCCHIRQILTGEGHLNQQAKLVILLTELFRKPVENSGNALIYRQRAQFEEAVAGGLETSCHDRSEEHTSELQSRGHLVCRLLLEQKK